MSIRLLAKDLYQYQRQVHRLEKMLVEAKYDQKVPIEALLRRARAQRDQMRRVLDGQIGR